MIEKTLDITTKDGEMETFICHPERNRPSPAVFLLMDAHGIREELKDMARRLATVGYYVLLPNLYYRAGRDTIFGPDVHEEGSAEHKRMRAIRTKMTIPPVMDDVGAMLSFADRQKEVKKGPVGCHGYCMSGPYALAAAALSRAHRRRRLVLRDLARQRGRGEPASLIGQGPGRVLRRLRRARQSGASADGPGAPYPVWAGRHRW
jgi:dienelactone hydrolase